MNTIKYLLIVAVFPLVSCAATTDSNPDRTEILYKYAQSSCIFWYLKDKGYDTSDIRAISGGIVEKSDISLDKFQSISFFVKEYTPTILTKNNIDVRLN